MPHTTKDDLTRAKSENVFSVASFKNSLYNNVHVLSFGLKEIPDSKHEGL